jgi:iron-sulfur cluster repair protein YtfE (RIC family)
VSDEQSHLWTDKLRIAARRLPELETYERMIRIADLVAFLHEELEPHMRVDEDPLYPGATALAYDHLAIRAWIGKLQEAEDEDVETLQELLYGLDALIRVHLWKEDELTVRPLHSSSWATPGL